jgi:hypothetical protein
MMKAFFTTLFISLPFYNLTDAVKAKFKQYNQVTSTTGILMPQTFTVCIINPNFVQTSGLINYWPFCSSPNDVIGNANLYNGNNVEFVANRNGVPGAALSLNTGFYQIPPGNYFPNTDFTITCWVNARAYNQYSRIVAFGNGAGVDDIDFVLSYDTNGHPYFGVYDLASAHYEELLNDYQLPLNEWVFMAATLSGQNLSMYANTTLLKTGSLGFTPTSVITTQNYVGRSSWQDRHGDQDANAIYDDLKLFNRALSVAEILFEMSNEYYN